MAEHVFTKCAWRLIPFMGLLYLVNYIDRTNAGFAALTMNKDLGFSSVVYGFGAGIFFIGYSLFQVPANVILERVGARRWIFSIMAVWGLLAAANALVTTPTGFYVVRFFLGVAEAGFTPGMAVNLNGLFFCCRAVVPMMVENGYGRIVNIASVAGKEGNPNASAYSASKAAVIGLTKSLGKELATKGVIANSITPATFESPILEQLPKSQVDYMRGKIPMGRLGEVHESAAMVCFMASEECSFTTASTFDTSGGRTTY